MSLQCLKKKGVIKHGGGMHMLCAGSPNISGKSPGGIWITQLPFCNNLNQSNTSFGNKGFSRVGGYRNLSYVGRTRKQFGTPFRGLYGIGYGGTGNQYPQYDNVYNMNVVKATLQGNQYLYIKPATLSNKAMIHQKYKYIYNGQYPLNWVQPVYPNGPLSQNSSMSTYIQKLKTQNSAFLGVNAEAQYEGFCRNTCSNKSDIGYTKTLHQPVDFTTYIDYIQRPCLNPKGRQKPFPFAVNNNTASSGNAFGPPPAITTQYYTTPPEWYIKSCPNNIK
jgi:hypothetical protein